MRNFTLAWLQVTLVCLNTWQVANGKIAGSIIVGFLISLVWCFNTQRVALSNFKDKIVYSSGAALGTATGIIISLTLYT
jgi:hypothetical protein